MEEQLNGHFHIRVTHKSEEDLTRYIRWLTSLSIPVMVCLEAADSEVNRDHTHAHVKSHLSLSRFRQLFKEKFPNYCGNPDYSVGAVRTTVRQNQQYVCKGLGDDWDTQAPNILYSNYPPELIRVRYDEYWRILNETNANRIKKLKKKDATTWLQMVHNEIVESTEGGAHVWDYGYNSKRIVFTHVMKALGRTVKKLSPKTVKELCDGILNALAPTAVQADFWGLVYPSEWSGQG